MQLIKAIAMLAPFHNAQLVAAYETETGITGQLSTGLVDVPFIAVNDSQVVADELFDVLVAHEATTLSNEYCNDFDFNSTDSANLFGTSQLAY